MSWDFRVRTNNLGAIREVGSNRLHRMMSAITEKPVGERIGEEVQNGGQTPSGKEKTLKGHYLRDRSGRGGSEDIAQGAGQEGGRRIAGRKILRYFLYLVY